MAKKVVLDWTDPAPTTYVNQLEIWRKLDGGTYAHIGGAQLGDETYDDESGVTDAQKYYYEVRAYNIDRKYSVVENNITISEFLLDLYTNAVGAYSLRKLKTGITYAIEIRRDNDDATTGVQVYSNGDSIDLSSIVSDGGVSMGTWVGANSAFVKTWYDQSGTGEDVIQLTGASQPMIVNAGALVTENGETTLDFNGRFFSTTITTTSSQPNTKIVVATLANINTTQYISDGPSGNRQAIGLISTNDWRLYAGTVSDYATGGSIGVQYLLFGLFDTTASSLSVNGSNLGTKSIGTNAYGNKLIMGAGTFDGNIQEHIIFSDDKSSSQSAIEADINNHYSIY